jgi:hypothetical protein
MGHELLLLADVGQGAAAVGVIAGTAVLILMLAALGGVVYRGLLGEGIRWPDDDHDEDGVRPGNDDEEWEYY